MMLPAIAAAESWPSRPGIALRVEMVTPRPAPRTEIEKTYATGLEALAGADVSSALRLLRDVVVCDSACSYSTAKLLVMLLSAQIGDVQTVAALHESCVTIAQPDLFAQRAITGSSVDMWARETASERSIVLDECIDQPAAAAQLALATCALAVDDRAAAVLALEDMVRVRDLRDHAWTARKKIILTTNDRNRRQLLSRTSGIDLTTADGSDLDRIEFNYFGSIPKAERDERFRSLDPPPDPNAPRQAAGRVTGLAFTLCELYEALGDADGVLRTLDRWTFDVDKLFKAWALQAKGLTGAALVVYDGAIKQGMKDRIRLQYVARYRKAALLIDLGETRRAKQELARLYADEPSFGDDAGLLNYVDRPKSLLRRESIPETVRSAVWRRDEGRCVKCGSNERLEYDHIIPVSKGGANTERNLQLLCEGCNRAKGARI